MKKEYLILIILILGLSAYLVLKQDNRVHYDLPELATIEAKEIDRIEIDKNDKKLVLSKVKDRWTIGEEAYLVDQSAMDNIMEVVTGLHISTLVSQSKDLGRYELDAVNAVTVKAFNGNKEIRTFSIGKTAPSANHTFVMLSQDLKIFQADKSFRNHFEKSMDEFRDKLVLSFKTEEIKKITVEKQGVAATLVLKTLEPKKEEGKKEDKKSDKAPETMWQSDKGTSADKKAIADLLSSLSHLECQSFEKKGTRQILEKKEPQCKISLENGTQININFFEPTTGEAMTGISSQNSDAFILAQYKGKDIISYVDTILGLKKEGETPEKE